MTRFSISKPEQLLPAQDLEREMIAAEALTGASSPGGTGPTNYVNADGNPIAPATVTADDGSTLLLPPGIVVPDAVKKALAGTVAIVSLTESGDLREIGSMVEDIQKGGDMAASARAVITDAVEFIYGGGN